MTLEWRRDRRGWLASCGEESQGVAPFRDGWAWAVDMLPGDIEPQIVGQSTFASLDDAKAEAQRQVDKWPALIEGARRA